MNQNKSISLINILGKMKDLKRRGWLMKNISLPESDADHSFGVAMLALLYTPSSLNKLKCLELALVHDLAEVYTGDYTPFDNINKEEKHYKELSAIKQIATELKTPHLIDLFNEYEESKTKEAKFIKLADKLETVLTAYYYEKNNRTKEKIISEFSAYAQKHSQNFSDDFLKELKEMINSIQN